jgi:hypothetical protein
MKNEQHTVVVVFFKKIELCNAQKLLKEDIPFQNDQSKLINSVT